MNEQPLSEQIRLFGMKNLMLESDLSKLEKQGIEIGHISTLTKEENVDPELFDSDIRKSAERMASFYIIYYCFENSVRLMIKETLSEKYGSDWWSLKVPDDIKAEVKKRQDEEKDSVMAIRSPDDPLSYSTFGELIPIIERNWDDFSDQLRSKKSMRQILSQFNKTRNIIAHSCEMAKDEVLRLELMVRDWQRIQT